MLIGLVLLTLFLPALIVLHELGHYWCAQWMGIELTDFSIGAGPLLRQWRHNGVDFKLQSVAYLSLREASDRKI